MNDESEPKLTPKQRMVLLRAGFTDKMIDALPYEKALRYIENTINEWNKFPPVKK